MAGSPAIEKRDFGVSKFTYRKPVGGLLNNCQTFDKSRNAGAFRPRARESVASRVEQ